MDRVESWIAEALNAVIIAVTKNEFIAAYQG